MGGEKTGSATGKFKVGLTMGIYGNRVKNRGGSNDGGRVCNRREGEESFVDEKFRWRGVVQIAILLG